MKINAAVISEAALDLLEETGLDGLSMRVVAARLGVRPGALYWHVKSKQELHESMATAIYTHAVEGLEGPRADEDWQDWLADWARRLRGAMLRHRDGARIFAGNSVRESTALRATELALRTLQDAGFSVRHAARGVSALMHYTVGFTMKEQAVALSTCRRAVDPTRFPLTAQAYVHDDLVAPDAEDCFEHGLAVIVGGLEAGETPRTRGGRHPAAG